MTTPLSSNTPSVQTPIRSNEAALSAFNARHSLQDRLVQILMREHDLRIPLSKQEEDEIVKRTFKLVTQESCLRVKVKHLEDELEITQNDLMLQTTNYGRAWECLVKAAQQVPERFTFSPEGKSLVKLPRDLYKVISQMDQRLATAEEGLDLLIATGESLPCSNESTLLSMAHDIRNSLDSQDNALSQRSAAEEGKTDDEGNQVKPLNLSEQPS